MLCPNRTWLTDFDGLLRAQMKKLARRQSEDGQPSGAKDKKTGSTTAAAAAAGKNNKRSNRVDDILRQWTLICVVLHNFYSAVCVPRYIFIYFRLVFFLVPRLSFTNSNEQNLA